VGSWLEECDDPFPTETGKTIHFPASLILHRIKSQIKTDPQLADAGWSSTKPDVSVFLLFCKAVVSISIQNTYYIDRLGRKGL